MVVGPGLQQRYARIRAQKGIDKLHNAFTYLIEKYPCWQGSEEFSAICILHRLADQLRSELKRGAHDARG